MPGFRTIVAVQHEACMGTMIDGAPHLMHDMGLPSTPVMSLRHGGSAVYPANGTLGVANAYGASAGIPMRGIARTTGSVSDSQQ